MAIAVYSLPRPFIAPGYVARFSPPQKTSLTRAQALCFRAVISLTDGQHVFFFFGKLKKLINSERNINAGISFNNYVEGPHRCKSVPFYLFYFNFPSFAKETKLILMQETVVTLNSWYDFLRDTEMCFIDMHDFVILNLYHRCTTRLGRKKKGSVGAHVVSSQETSCVLCSILSPRISSPPRLLSPIRQIPLHRRCGSLSDRFVCRKR